MPAKGATVRTRLEAPATEPLPFSAAAVAARDVARSFGATHALAGIEPDVADGEVGAIGGPSGCGKSTLLELLAGLQEPDAGSVSVRGGANATARLRSCAFMPQRDLLLP